MLERLTLILGEARRWGLLIAACALVLGLGAWLLEHDARVRQAAEAAILDRQDKLAIQLLKNEADMALAAVAASAAREKQAAAQLSARVTAEQQLQFQLVSLQAAAQRDKERHAALPPAQVRAEVVKRLGPESVVGAEQDSARTANAVRQPLELTDVGIRKVDEALLDLKACREQNALGNQLLENCLGQRDSLSEIAQERGTQLDGYKLALKAQQDLNGQQKAQFERQLATVRGSWLKRTWEKVDGPIMLGVGVLIGYKAAK